MTVDLRDVLAAAAKDIQKAPLLAAMILPPPPPGHCWRIQGWNATAVPSDCNGCAGESRVMVSEREKRLWAAAIAEKPDGTPFYTDEEMEQLAAGEERIQ